MKSLPTYVISLPFRSDRRKAMSEGLTALDIDFVFVDAVDIQFYNKTFDTNFVFSKHAIWRSHVLAYEDFLRSNFCWAVILEDDIDFANSVLLSEAQLDKVVKNIVRDSIKIDMFQFGYNSDKSESLRQQISDWFFTIFRFRRYEWRDMSALLRKVGLFNFFSLSQSISIPSHKVLALKHHSERGCHYYLINRSLATHLVEYFYGSTNVEELLPIDTYLHWLSTYSKNYEIIRPSKSFAVQSDSKSSNIS